MIALEAAAGGLRLTTPYDAAFLNAFKAAVPYAARTWQKPYWIIDPAYGAQVASLVKTYFGADLAPPAKPIAPAGPETRAVELQYLGRCKDRGDGASSAYGYANGAWSIIFPETVLRAHFGAQDQQSDATPTFYATLGIARTANDDEIKRAFRRLARQWHPDVCKEPDARDQFETIKRAYDMLSDASIRRKYDAALTFEASLNSTQRGAAGWDNAASVQYRAPLRCGLVLIEGTYQIGRFAVSKILDWQDIVRNGKTMVSSWDSDNEKIRIEWV